MGRTRLLILGMGFCLGMMISGCASQKKQENTNQAFQAIEALEYEQALSLFELAANSGEEARQVNRGRGIALLGLTRYDEAIEAFLAALSDSDSRIDEFDYDTNYYLASAYCKQEKWKEGEAVYSAILNLRPEKEGYYLRGIVYLKQEEVKKAISDFDEALRLDPSDYDLRIDVYQALAKEGYQEEGRTYLQAVMGTTGNKISDQNRGRFSYYLGDYEAARSYLESLKGEKDSESTLLLGQTYEKLGDYNYAASVYSNFLADHHDDVKILNRLGMCRLQSGDAAAALECFNQALALGDSSMTQTLKFNQIVAVEYLGDFDQANVLMKAYLQSYPDDQDAQREYEFLMSR